MKNWLRKDEYLDYAEDLLPNEGINVNHEDCDAGTDTKKRLYIRRSEDGNVILAYCHHCGRGGSHRLQTRPIFKKTGRNKPKSSTTSWKLPADFTPHRGEWSPFARVWIGRYGITDEEIRDNHLGYSERLRRVILPCYDAEGLAWYQCRKVDPKDEGPKYVSRTNRKSLFIKELGTDPIVLCEDILSSIKVARQFSSCALRGVFLSDKDIINLTKSHSHVIIFLDDDKKEVRKQQMALRDQLRMFCKVTLIKDVNKDPKELTDTEIHDIIYSKI